MSARGFIDEIFSRPQERVAGNIRRVTARQFDKVRELIAGDPERGAVKSGINGGLVWSPAGRWKYVLAVDPVCDRRTITRLEAVDASESGSLFGDAFPLG